MDRGKPRVRRSAKALIVLGAVVGISFLIFSVALGNPASGFFELDGNITNQAAVAGDDWATLYGGGGSFAKFSGISEDVVNGTQKATTGAGTNVCPGILPSGSTLSTCDDVATGGSTKDDINFSSWNWIWQQANDKNDIEHTFAALYNDTSGVACTAPNTPPGCNVNFGHNFAVFGLDKLSNSGSASVGFWFTNDQISLTNPGINNSPNGKFVGSHKNGDVLVQSDFTSGGSVSRVEVFVWCNNNPAGADVCDSYPGPASHPNLISQGQQAFDCTTAPATAGFCGIATQASTTNTDTVWPFLYKFSGGVAPASTYPASTFFEGGVDLTRLFGDTIPCFSSGLGETRQSQSETSVLVDFHLFSFDVCSANISISPSGVNEVGATHTITATVTKSVVNTTTPAPDGTLVTFSITSGPGSFVGGVNTCTTTGGTCSVQITSSVTGVTVVNASTTVSFGGGVTKSASTTGLNGNSGPVTKRWVDAQIDLTPLTATNEVNSAHTITATVQQDDGLTAAQGGDGVTGFGPAPNGTTVTFSLLNNTAGATFVGGVNTCTTTAGSCTVQINTSTAGGVDIHATTTFSVGGVSLTRATGTGGLNSADAHKTYVDAQIDLTPLTATNEVNQAHTITATVQQDDGLTAAQGGDGVTGFGPAPNGTTVTFSLLNNTAGATFVGGVNTCTTTAGSCTVQINTSTAGGVDIHATTTFSVGGVSLTRATGTGGLNSADAHKTYVDAQIDLTPLTATNEVNQAHTITATVQQDDGLTAAQGGDGVTGFGPAPNGTTVTFSLLNNTAGATFVGGVNTCTTTAGSCTVQINTSTAGGVDIHATTTFSVGGVSLTRATGTGGLNSADAHKTYVDAQIDLTPLTATNEVNQAHTITATVQQDDGLTAAQGGDGVTGFGPAPNGTTVTFSLLNNTAGATFVGGVNTCTTTAGSCTVQINTSTAGGVDIHATTTFSVGGVSLTRATGTGGLNSADAHKTYVDAQIDLTPLTATNEVNQAHTITATVQQDDGLTAAQGGDGVTGFGPAPNGTTVTFSLLNNTAGATFVGGVNTCTTTAGSCTVQINTSTAGGVDIHATTTFSVGGVSLTRATGTGGLNSADAHKTYVDAQIDLTPLTATNEVNQAHTITATVQQDDGLTAAQGGDGVTGFGPAPNGTTVTFSLLNNTAGATFVGGVNTCTTTAGSCTVQINTSTAGGVDIHATTTFSVGGVSLTRATGTGGLNSADAHKTYVDAQIDLSPLTDTDPVGDIHAITATVQQDDGLTAAQGGDGVTGFGPAPNGTTVTFSLLNNTANAVFTPAGVNTCTTTAGQCTIHITTNTAGSVDIHATTTFSVGGVSLTRATGTGGLNSDDAHKVFVDAAITITPTATNFIYDPHTFTVSVTANGQPADNGHVDVTLTGGDGIANADIQLDAVASTCDDAGQNLDVNGQCTITFTSPETGTVTGHATVTLTVGGVTLTRETDGVSPNSGNAVKTFVSAQVTLNKTFATGVFTTPGQACFTLSRTAPAPPPVSSDSLTQCGTGTSLSFTWHDLVSGDYTISETTVPAGYSKMTDITFTVTSDVNDAANLSRSFSANDPLLPGSFKILKKISGSTDLGTNTFTFRVQPCGSDSTCASPGTQIANSPFIVTNATNPITISGLPEGYYLVTEINIPAGFTPDVNPQIVAVHAGDVGTGNPVTVTFNNKPTELTALAPTSTTCDQFATGQALPQEDETYGLRQGKITNISPGVFFFYASYSVTNTPQTLSVDAVERFNSSVIDPANITNDWVVQNGQAFLYSFANGTCTKLTTGVTTSISGGQVVITLDPAGSTPVPNGTYVLGIKYTNSASLIGVAPCHGGATPCHYYFIPSRDSTELTSRAQALLFRKR